MLADPQVLTVDSVAKSMPRISTEAQQSLYSTADEEVKMRISHQESKGRTRHMIRADLRVIAANPLTSVNEYKTLGVYLVVDEPEYGFSDDAIKDLIAGMTDWLTASTMANTAKVLGGEH
jgi:hypothetical protein